MNTLALCVPAYNAESFLPRLLLSAKNQAVPFDEILVYNDASTDQTAKVAECHGARVIEGITNLGCSSGKNILANLSKCKWVHFHDADDDLLPDFTERVHDWINRAGDQYDVLLLNFKYVDFSSGNLLMVANYDADELRRDALKYAIDHKIVNFGVYKLKPFLDAGGFDLGKEVLYNEDSALHQRLAGNGLKFDYLPEITCINYRYQASMSSSNQLKCARAKYHVLAKTASAHGSTYPFELSRQLWICIASLGAAQDWEYVEKAIKLSKRLGYPFSPVGSRPFKLLTRVNPFLAAWFREKMIRLLKPHLRHEI